MQVKTYFQDLQLCFITADFTTTGQHLEVGIMEGCTLSPLSFTVVIKVISMVSRCTLGGEQTKAGPYLPPIRTYMGDMTTLTTTATCRKWLLGKLQENTKWA